MRTKAAKKENKQTENVVKFSGKCHWSGFLTELLAKK